MGLVEGMGAQRPVAAGNLVQSQLAQPPHGARSRLIDLKGNPDRDRLGRIGESRTQHPGPGLGHQQHRRVEPAVLASGFLDQSQIFLIFREALAGRGLANVRRGCGAYSEANPQSLAQLGGQGIVPGLLSIELNCLMHLWPGIGVDQRRETGETGLDGVVPMLGFQGGAQGPERVCLVPCRKKTRRLERVLRLGLLPILAGLGQQATRSGGPLLEITLEILAVLIVPSQADGTERVCHFRCPFLPVHRLETATERSFPATGLLARNLVDRPVPVQARLNVCVCIRPGRKKNLKKLSTPIEIRHARPLDASRSTSASPSRVRPGARGAAVCGSRPPGSGLPSRFAGGPRDVFFSSVWCGGCRG